MPLGPVVEGYTGGFHVPRDKRREMYTTVSLRSAQGREANNRLHERLA